MKITAIILILILLGFVPLWPKQIKNRTIKVGTYTKIQLVLGIIKLD